MCLKLVKTSVLQKHTGCNNRLLECSLIYILQQRSVSTKDAHSILEFKVNLWLFTLAKDRFVELKLGRPLFSSLFSKSIHQVHTVWHHEDKSMLKLFWTVKIFPEVVTWFIANKPAAAEKPAS